MPACGWGRAVLAAGLVVAQGTVPANAEGLRRLDAAWVVPTRLAAIALDINADGTSGGVWVRAGQSRLFGLAELPVRHLAVGVCRPHGTWALEGGWETAGAGGLHDDRMQARLLAGRRLRFGAECRWRRVQPGPGGSLSEQTWDLVLGLDTSAGTLGRIDAVLTWPLLRTADATLAAEPRTRLRIAAAARGWAVALTLDTRSNGPPSGGWEAVCSLGGGFGLSWRADHGSGAMGTGLIWQRGGLRLRSSHLGHPDLAVTHRFEVALGATSVSPW